MTREQILKELKESKVSEAIIDECADRIMGLIDNVCPNCDGSGFEVIQKECENCGGAGTIAQNVPKAIGVVNESDLPF